VREEQRRMPREVNSDSKPDDEIVSKTRKESVNGKGKGGGTCET
jgi:hypothetical protein